MSFFSLVSETESTEAGLGDLFKKNTKKDAPDYDYTEVDQKKSNSKKLDPAEDFDENEAFDDTEEDEEAQVKKDKVAKLENDKMAKVKHEDTKERIIDEEKEKRTIENEPTSTLHACSLRIPKPRKFDRERREENEEGYRIFDFSAGRSPFLAHAN